MSNEPQTSPKSPNEGVKELNRLAPSVPFDHPLLPASTTNSQDEANGTNQGNTSVPGFKNDDPRTSPRTDAGAGP